MKTILYALLSFIFINTANAQSTESKSSVSITDSDHKYEFSASYNSELDKQVQGYMNDQIGNENNFSFKNTRVDATMTLDNKITFYIKNSPGKLILKLDKRKNSTELYNQFKKMCEGIRDLIQKK